MVAIVLIASLVLSCLPVYATGVEVTATVLNSAPSVDVELTPDDDPATPGVQVINPDPTMNKTVTIIANVTDLNGYDHIVNTSVAATITGPSVVEDSPVSLSFDSVVNVTTKVYTGSFNMSNHSEGNYEVEVTATDFGGLTGVGSKNFTYLYGEPVVTVTTYDFSTGAGLNKWAYKPQVGAKPPATNDVPNIEFENLSNPKKNQYVKISTDNRKAQSDSTNLSGYYAAHRFVFDIADKIPAENIVEIGVLWNGKGTHTDREKSGATLYIWNATSSVYKELNTTISGKEVYLTGEITVDCENCIDATGNLTILVEQNYNQTIKGKKELVSKISTDYVKVDITHLSLSASTLISTSTSTAAVSEASTAEENVNSLLDRVQQGGITLFRWLFGG
ncbi:MAG TPA: hypothetical protein C5S37_05885 [Methanophagales archaeon]|nr:hypothetical protein [Methanophagales archaeon]